MLQQSPDVSPLLDAPGKIEKPHQLMDRLMKGKME